MATLTIVRGTFSEEIEIKETIAEIDKKLENKIHTWKDSFIEFTKMNGEKIRILPNVIIYFQ